MQRGSEDDFSEESWDLMKGEGLVGKLVGTADSRWPQEQGCPVPSSSHMAQG